MYFLSIGDNILINFANVYSVVKQPDHLMIYYYGDKPPAKLLIPPNTDVEYVWNQLLVELTGETYGNNTLH